MKATHLVLAGVFTLAGCGSGEPAANNEAFGTYISTVDEPMPFRLPAGSNSIQITQDEAEKYGTLGEFKQSSYKHPGKWVVYLASAPWVTEGSSKFTARAGNDAVASSKIMRFLVDNGLKDRVDFVWLQYDALPQSKEEGWGGLGVGEKLPAVLWSENTHSTFDAYVFSQAARYPGQPGLLYSDWIRPFILYPEGENGVIWRQVDVEAGIDDVNGKFWDRWGRHFFIVDPEGMVRDAYVSMNRETSPIQAMRSIAHHMGLDHEGLEFPKHLQGSEYVAYYSPTLEGEFHDTMNLIDKGMRGE